MPLARTATVTWDGGGNGTSWTDAKNWSGDKLPGSADDVVIDVAGNPTITLASGNDSIRSLQCEEAFVLEGGSLTVTSAASYLNGVFRMNPGTSLQVRGLNTSLSAPNAANIHGASLYVDGGARLSLPLVRSYTGSPADSVWEVQGVGSVLDLSGMTTLQGAAGYHWAKMVIRALGGGQIDLSGLTEIAGGSTYVTADGQGSASGFDGVNPNGWGPTHAFRIGG